MVTAFTLIFSDIVIIVFLTVEGENSAVPTYDYVEDTLQSGKFNAADNKVAINGDAGGMQVFHATGPSTASQAPYYSILESNEHIYEDDGFVSVPSGDKQGFSDPLYEDPSASEARTV